MTTTMNKNSRAFASYSFVLRTNRKNKIGEYPICIRITKDGKSSITASIYSSTKSCWNAKSQRPHLKHPDYNELNNYLDKAESSLKLIIIQLKEESHSYTAGDVLERYKTPIVSFVTVREYYETIMQRMLQKNQHSTYYTYKSAFDWLNKYKPLEQLRIEEINYTFLENLHAFIFSQNPLIKGSTLFGYFKNYKAFMRSAINEDIIPEGKSNFMKFSLSRFNTESKPMTLNNQQVGAIKALEFAPHSNMWHARNYFLFSLVCGGINFTDMAKLTVKNLENDRISYSRSKSGVFCKFKLNDTSREILANYEGYTYGEYLFPIINRDCDTKQVYTRIKSAAKQVNKDLKLIGNMIGVSKLHFYAARHTVATTMKFMEVPSSAIAETIGHSGERTIKKYLRKFPDKYLEDLNEKLHSEVFNT